MSKFKVFLICMSMLAGGVTAGAKTINTLVINRTDGKTDKIAMHRNLDVSINDKGEILMVHPEVTVAYPREQVKNFTVGFQAFAAGMYYIGDNQVKEEDAVVAPEVDGVTVLIDRSVIAVSGVKQGVRLIDLQGKTVVNRAVSGSVEISIAELPAGVYVLVADKTTLKIKI